MAGDTTVAVLGTRIMGAAMARNLLVAGMKVRLWNRSREKAEPLARDGAEVADAPTEAAGEADFLLTMLPDADIIEEVLGEEVLPALAEGAVWLQMSTVGEEGNARLARLAEGAVVAYVDAPVLGTKGPAEAGEGSSCSPRGPRGPGRGASASSGRWAERHRVARGGGEGEPAQSWS